MAISCPNKRLSAWRDLVKVVGEPTAYVLWGEYDGVVPDSYYSLVKSIKEGAVEISDPIESEELGFEGSNSAILYNGKQIGEVYYASGTEQIYKDKIIDQKSIDTNINRLQRTKSTLLSQAGKNSEEQGVFYQNNKIQNLTKEKQIDFINIFFDNQILSEKNTLGDISPSIGSKSLIGRIMGSLGSPGIIINEEYRGRGIGKLAYIALNKKLSERGLVLKSEALGESQIGENATNVWKSLIKDGLAIKIKDGYEFKKDKTDVRLFAIDPELRSTRNTIIADIIDIGKRRTGGTITAKHGDDYFAARGDTRFLKDKNSKFKSNSKVLGDIAAIYKERYGFDVFYVQDGKIVFYNLALDRISRENIKLNQLTSTKPTAAKIEALNTKLIQLLSVLNVTVEDYENFMEKHGVDAIAMFEIVNGVAKISIDPTKENELTLPEETAHFIIEAMGKSPLAKRMLDLMKVNDYYKEVLGSNYDAYFEAYKGAEDLLVKEAAGQILSQAIVSNFKQENLNIPEMHLNMLQRLWNYVREMFGRISRQELNKAIADVYGNVANEFMQGNTSFMKAITLSSDIRLFSISDSALEGLKISLEKARESSAKRLNVYKKKDLKRTAAVEELALRNIEEQLEKKDYMLAALSVSEHARNMFKGVTKRIKELKDAIENLDVIGQDALMQLASTLRDMKSFTDSYLPMIKEIQSEVTEILYEEPDNTEYKKIDEILTEVAKKAEQLNKKYLEMARPIWAKYLLPFLYEGPITEANLLESLKDGGKDITFVQRFVDSMAASGMPVLQILDVAVKDAKQSGRDESYVAIKDLIAARMELEKAGVKDTKWMYELKRDKSISGNDVYEYNYGDWQDARKAEGDKILATIRTANKGLVFPENDKDLLDMIHGNEVLSDQYKRMWAWWFRTNSQANPMAAEIIAEKKRTLPDEEYQDWYEENTSFSEDKTIIYYIRDLSIPADKYKNKQYIDIQNNPAMKKYYDMSIRLKEEHDNKLPRNQRLGRMAPQTRTDVVEKIKRSASIGEAGRNIKQTITEAFQNVEDDTDIGSKFKVTDENGKIVYFLPIHFTGKLKDMRDLSTDSTESLAAFIAMSNDYSKMSKIIDILELGRDVISNINLQEFDSNGNPIKESINILGKKVAKLVKQDPKTSNMKARLDDFFKMNIYGQTRVEGTDFNILGVKMNSEKMWNLLGKYTSLNNLALNIYAGIQNPLIGNANIRIEAIASQFFGQKALAMADAKYWAELPRNLANLGARNSTDFISLWSDKMEVMQDFSREASELNMDRGNVLQKLASTNALYVTSSAGEHMLQFRSSFALAYETKLKNASGKEITLLDAFDVVGNKLVLKPGLTKSDGSTFTERDLRAWKRKQNAINNNLHGIYNDQDLLAMQQYGAWRQVLMFRKFMRPGYNRRFRSKMYDYERQSFVEGYYRTFGRFTTQMIKDLRRGQFLMAANWKKMSPMERQNMMRAMADIGYMLATMTLIGALGMMGAGDDEDDWAGNMAMYQSNRLLTELSFFIDPRQTMTILKSPSAGIDTINGIINLAATAANPFTAFDIIERGKFQGHTRLYKSAVGVVPFAKTATSWFYPEDKLVYLKLK